MSKNLSNHFLIADGASMDAAINTASNATLIMMQFSRKNVEKGLTGDAIDRLCTLSESESNVIRFAGNMLFAFDGYDNDPREIWQIPECINFMRGLDAEWPYWFHFLEKTGPSIQMLISLLCDMVVVEKKGMVIGTTFKDFKQVTDLLEHQFHGLNNLEKHFTIPKEISQKVEDDLKAILDQMFPTD